MATEILVNDGGAPARIIPLIANEAITAGDALGVIETSSGNDVKAVQLEQAEATNAMMVGVALTDAAADTVCNVVTGRGVIVRINVDNVDGAIPLMPHATTGGLLIQYVAAASGSNKGFDGTPCAVTMENNTGAGLTKCMIL